MRLERKLMTVPVLLLFARGGFGQGGPHPKESVAVAISVARVEFKPGVPVAVRLTMTNISDRDLRFEVMVVQCKLLDYQPVTVRQIQVQVDDGEGNPVAMTPYGQVVQASARADKVGLGASPARFGGCAGKSQPAVLKPGESLTEEAELYKEFEIKKSGGYTVRAQRVDHESKAVVMSAAVPVTLVAKQ